jgi:hypothetical protein
MLQKLKWWTRTETHKQIHTDAWTHTQQGNYTMAMITSSDSDVLQTYGTNQGIYFRVTDLFASLISGGK